jgi:hypothetical protein
MSMKNCNDTIGNRTLKYGRSIVQSVFSDGHGSWTLCLTLVSSAASLRQAVGRSDFFCAKVTRSNSECTGGSSGAACPSPISTVWSSASTVTPHHGGHSHGEHVSLFEAFSDLPSQSPNYVCWRPALLATSSAGDPHCSIAAGRLAVFCNRNRWYMENQNNR